MNIKEAIISINNKLGILVCNSISEELLSIMEVANKVSAKENTLVTKNISHAEWIKNATPSSDLLPSDNAAIIKAQKIGVQGSLFKQGRGRDVKTRGRLTTEAVVGSLEMSISFDYNNSSKKNRVFIAKNIQGMILTQYLIAIHLQTVVAMLKGKTWRKIYDEVYRMEETNE